MFKEVVSVSATPDPTLSMFLLAVTVVLCFVGAMTLGRYMLADGLTAGQKVIGSVIVALCVVVGIAAFIYGLLDIGQFSNASFGSLNNPATSYAVLGMLFVVMAGAFGLALGTKYPIHGKW